MEHPASDVDAAAAFDLLPQQLLEPDLLIDLTAEGTAATERGAVAELAADRSRPGVQPPPLDLSNEDEDPDRTGELVIDEHVLEQIRSSNHPSAGRRIGGQCDPSRSRFASFAQCPHCGGDLAAEHAHFRCGSCGWRDSCCD